MTMRCVTTSPTSTVFFFSSRRRHTRLVSDWSSDVCSSDLVLLRATRAHASPRAGPRTAGPRTPSRGSGRRSEERRVGKECRYRGAPYNQKKKIFSEELIGVESCGNVLALDQVRVELLTPQQ